MRPGERFEQTDGFCNASESAGMYKNVKMNLLYCTNKPCNVDFSAFITEKDFVDIGGTN